jgi:hypothetical protein
VAAWSALHSARAACLGRDLVVAVGKVAFALDSALGLHPGVEASPAWQALDRCWWSMHSAVTVMVPVSVQRHLLDRAAAALDVLAARLAEADEDESAVTALEDVLTQEGA